ncbi:single-stranded DNA-binding protein [Gulosibacter sp. GYB002]|uniref:single-stranded DNA-binding protein n=1 Tax=Gulosibacter sp. GYB002 TaxID=2994391 RepID=UPI002F96C43D
MAGETNLTLVGNLTADPELRYTPNGVAVANFTVASTSRVFDRQAGEWRDGDALFLRCTVWREFAEHVASSVQRGARVIVQGRLKQRSYETEQGDKRTVIELEVEELGPSLRYATAQVTKAGATTSGSGWAAAGASSSAPASPSQGQASWTAQQPPQAPEPSQQQMFSDEPPF